MRTVLSYTDGKPNWSDNVEGCSAKVSGHGGRMVGEVVAPSRRVNEPVVPGSPFCGQTMANGRICGAKAGHQDHHRRTVK